MTGERNIQREAAIDMLVRRGDPTQEAPHLSVRRRYQPGDEVEHGVPTTIASVRPCGCADTVDETVIPCEQHDPNVEHCGGCGRTIVSPTRGDLLDASRWCSRCGGNAVTKPWPAITS